MRGPKEIESSKAATIQLVPAGYVYQDKAGDLGLTIHLPIDQKSGTFAELVRFLDMQGSHLFDEHQIDGIPCFVIALGSDIKLTHRVLLYLLQNVFEYPAETRFECEVYDEGSADSVGPSEILPIHPERPPLRVDQGGVVRVGNSRISLDLIVEQYENGMTPEDLVRAYDTLQLGDVHAVIAYYLRHAEAVRAYLHSRKLEAEALQAKIENERPRISPAELLARRGAREKDRAPTGH